MSGAQVPAPNGFGSDQNNSPRIRNGNAHSQPKIPPSIQNAIGTLVVAAVVGISGVLIDTRLGLSRHLGESEGRLARISELERKLGQGDRFTREDGKRIWRELDRLGQSNRDTTNLVYTCQQRIAKLEAAISYISTSKNTYTHSWPDQQRQTGN